MRYYILILCLILNQYTVTGQQEVEIIKLEYVTSGVSIISDSPFKGMDQIATANTSITATINYGHDLKKDKSSMFYSASYSHFKQKLDFTAVEEMESLDNIPTQFYQYPNFSQFSFTSGVDYKFNNKWSSTVIGSVNYTDDFSDSRLKSNFTWLGLTYIERIENKNFSYGLGLFVNQLENKLLFTPSISLKLKNEKIGLEVLIPEKIRLWYKVQEKNYLELGLNAKSLSIEHANNIEAKGLDIYTIKGEVAYNIIWQDFLKLKAGVDLPLMLNSVKTAPEDFEFYQYNSLGFNLSISLTIPYE